MKFLKFLLKGVLGVLAVFVLLIGAYVGYKLIRWPTMSQLKKALGRDLTGNRSIAAELCHNQNAAGIVGTSFLKDYRPNEPLSVPIPELHIQSPGSAEHKGHGVAHISGLAQSSLFVGGDTTLIPDTPCSGTVSFDYQFYWDDNGVSSQWTCAISNVAVVNP